MGLPIPNLDDKTFDEIIKEARSLIARYAPGWTDHNVHDPGITFIELFSWLAETQIYQLNRITDAQYLKFLRMVGITPFSAHPAEVEIAFDDIKNEKSIEINTQLITIIGSERVAFKTVEDFTLVPVTLEAVKTIHGEQTTDHTQANETEKIHFYPFGVIAPESAELWLGFDGPLPEKEIRITFDLYEGDLSPLGSHAGEQTRLFPSVELVWEYFGGGIWKSMTVKKDTTAALNRSGSIVFDGPPSMNEKDGSYWVRCKIAQGHYEIVPLINKILLNVIPTVQIETIQSEELGTGQEMPDHSVSLQRSSVIKGSQIIQVQKENGKWETWEEVDDFESSGPDDLHYTCDPKSGEITFGNGLNGHIPQKSEKIIALVYETTLSEKGNIPKGQIFLIEKSGFEGIRGTNLKDAIRGEAAESIEDAKIRAKKEFRTPYRAINSKDFEQLALSTPGLRVDRAKAIPNYNPEYPCLFLPGTVTVVVVPHAREGTVTPVPSEGFLQTILNHLDLHRLLTAGVHVVGPEYVNVSVQCNVHIRKRSSPTEVEKRVNEALKRFLDPLKGGPEKDGWPFGRPIHVSEIYQVIDGVEGVDYAAEVVLAAEGHQQKRDAIRISPIALAYSGEHKLEIIEKGGQR